MLTTLGERAADAWRRLEIHVGDPHADLNVVFAVNANLLVVLHRIGAKPVVRRIEVVLPVGRRRECGRRRGGRKRRAATHCPDHRGQSRISQERPAIQPAALRHDLLLACL